MIRLKIALAIATGSALLATTGRAEETYTADTSHAHVGFQVPHIVISNVKGSFDDFAASLALQDGKLKDLEATLNVASISTKNAKRDEHLKSGDFFDEKQFPTITFVSTMASKRMAKISFPANSPLRA